MQLWLIEAYHDKIFMARVNVRYSFKTQYLGHLRYHLSNYNIHILNNKVPMILDPLSRIYKIDPYTGTMQHETLMTAPLWGRGGRDKKYNLGV